MAVSDMSQPELKRRTTAPVMAMSTSTTMSTSTSTTMDEEEDKQGYANSTSIMLALIPASIQSRMRMPAMPSLRRTKSGSMSGYPGKAAPSPPRTRSSSGAATPISEATESDTTMVGEEDTLGALWAPKQRPDVLSELATRGVVPSGSAVEWRCGRPGMELLISAVDESMNAGRSTTYDAAFERRAYLDGVSYLLRGLPRDLDAAEVAALRKSLPGPMAESLSSGPNTSNSMPRIFLPRRDDDGTPTFLQRSMKVVVARLIVWFCLIWPHVLLLLKLGAHYERKHKISEQLLARAIVLVNALGKRSVAVSQVIGKMGDGAVGQAVNEAVAWTVHGVASGISEGVEEGLSQTNGKWMA